MVRAIGLKLKNFRLKLALATDQKKITQAQFGELFGGYNQRQIASYETGENEIPARLFYLIWEAGYSIDDIFSEHAIAVPPDDGPKPSLGKHKPLAGRIINAALHKNSSRTNREGKGRGKG